MADFSQLPYPTSLDVRPFVAHAPEEKVEHFKHLLRLSPVGPAVFENTSSGRRFGIERDWLVRARTAWLQDFDWRRVEARINSFPNFIASGVRDGDGGDDGDDDKTSLHHAFDIHFAGLFSKRRDAVPIVFLHGWPSSFAAFLDVLELLRTRYTPDSLPFHVVVPSLPGYAYSSSAPLDRDWGGTAQLARVVDGLMVGLGLDGYVAQGGDLGSFVGRMLAATAASCRGMHVNMMTIPACCVAADGTAPALDAEEQAVVDRAAEMLDTGYGFALEQGSRGATLGFVLGASPLALLAWVGEKLVAWTDGGEPAMDKVLETVTLYWMTETIGRSFYHNRFLGSADSAAAAAAAADGGGSGGGGKREPRIARISVVSNMSALQRHLPYVEKPCGYSLFAGDIVPVPERWAAKTCNLVSFRYHASGGHFAAMERPKELLDDVEAFIDEVWGGGRQRRNE